MSDITVRLPKFLPVRPVVFDLQSPFRGSSKTEILSGLTVALALVPEAVAFAFVAGVPPLVGLYSAFIICLITALLGGRPGMISGATGAMAVVVVSLVATHGIIYLFPAVVLCGILQILIGAIRLGKLIRLVPHPVMLGFVNGLAIVILLAQVGSFKTLSADGAMVFLSGIQLWIMVGLVALTMAIIFLLPRLTRAVPSPLAAILIVSALAWGINRTVVLNEGAGTKPVLTVRDMLVDSTRAAAVRGEQREKQVQVLAAAQAALPPGLTAIPDPKAEKPAAVLSPEEVRKAAASVDVSKVGIAGGLPRPAWLDYALPPFSLATLWIILPFSLVLAGVGLIESLINVKSGGRRRLSGITAAVVLMLFVLFLAPLIEAVPMAALVGVMLMVVIGTFEWTTLQTWRRVPASEVLVMLLVAGYTVVMHDLATAVILGVVVWALIFAWNKSKHLMADVQHNEFGSKIYQLHGALFFGTVLRFREFFDPVNDPDDVVIDFYFTRVYDQSALEAINALAERYTRA